MTDLTQNDDSELSSTHKSASLISCTCPRCKHGKSWRSSFRSSDSLLHILFYKPYRCRACMSRFWKLYSSLRLNVAIASCIIALTGLGIFVNSLLSASPNTLALTEKSEDSTLKRHVQEGDSTAALQTGVQYFSMGMTKQGSKLLEQAAKKNNLEAQYYYGMSLLSGKGVIQDYKAGFYWLDHAAHKGYPEAQYSLGKIYRRGTGVEIDRARAYLWFNLAASQGITDAARNRDGVANHLDLKELIAMQEEAYRISNSYNTTSLSENTFSNNLNKITLK